MTKHPKASSAEDDGLVQIALRIERADLVEAKQRAASARQPWSQFLRNLIHAALRAHKVMR